MQISIIKLIQFRQVPFKLISHTFDIIDSI